jgi:hypothetical protein
LVIHLFGAVTEARRLRRGEFPTLLDVTKRDDVARVRLLVGPRLKNSEGPLSQSGQNLNQTPRPSRRKGVTYLQKGATPFFSVKIRGLWFRFVRMQGGE